MKNFSKNLLGLALCAAAFAPQLALPQAFPTKPVRMVVPSPPGGGSDILSRLLAQKMTESMGQAVIVENRAGADGIIGSEYVAHASPDGYTLLVGNATAQVANIFLHKSLPYDPVKDFTPISGGVESITCIVVNPDLSINTVKDLVDYAKRNPGKFTYGSSGAGGAYHMSGEAFKAAAGLDMVHIPYKGLAPSMTAVISGEISGAFTSVTVALPQARAGKAKIVAVLEGKRYSKLPDVPVVRETIPGFQAATIWNGFFGPAKMAESVVARLNAEFDRALRSPDIEAKLDASEIIFGSPQEFAAYVRGQVETFGKIAKIVGIKAD